MNKEGRILVEFIEEKEWKCKIINNSIKRNARARTEYTFTGDRKVQ